MKPRFHRNNKSKKKKKGPKLGPLPLHCVTRSKPVGARLIDSPSRGTPGWARFPRGEDPAEAKNKPLKEQEGGISFGCEIPLRQSAGTTAAAEDKEKT